VLNRLDQQAAAPLAEEAPLSREYRPLSGHYDEMCTDDGGLRPHWQYVVRALEALGTMELDRRWNEVRRLLHENGVTYNIYDEPQPTERLWPLDPIPVLLTSAEWSVIEHGLIQRAELLDLILADLYGPRRLIRSGSLPAELIFAHPGFLRPCDGLGAGNRRRLLLYAADLARTPDGRMWIIGDRAQAPSGAGYALENRTVLSRVFPSLYRDSHVHRLALFFRAVRATLHELNPRGQDDPRVVLLTPGPENEAYFEHAYLASYLGYPLVHGGDLTVHDERVWLKALDGPRLVDVILRRVDDDYCDPLELRPGSLLGTAGLLQAARVGQVGIANPLGSGVLEHPALMAFLPALARELLGEDLRLPSVATWWCGGARELAYVLEHLDRLVIKPIFPHASGATVFGSRLGPAARDALAAEIRARPREFVGQEPIPLSTAPVVVEGRLAPRPMVIRTFLTSRAEGYVVMPGGLGRVAPHPDTPIVSNQYGGVSKDVWVLASEPERQVSLLTPSGRPLAVTRDGDDVPGRVADDLFWLGRYTERTDGTVRLLREVLLRLIGADRIPQDDELILLLRTVTSLTGTLPGFVGDGAEARLRAPEGELASVLLDRRRPGSVRFDIDAVVRVGRAVRDRLSGDAVRVINALNRELARPCELAVGLEGLQRVIIHLAAFAGLCGESMSHGQAWRFLEIGRHLERALNTIVLLRGIFVPARARGGWSLEALLAVAHSVKTYRRRYRSRVEPSAVLDLLLLDESNPRSVGHELRQLEQLIADLVRRDEVRRTAPERLALDALTHLRLFDVDLLSSPDVSDGAAATDGFAALGALLDRLTERLAALSDELASQYFRHAEPPQQLVRLV